MVSLPPATNAAAQLQSKIALIDDNFSVRLGIKLILHAVFAAMEHAQLALYSASDGVEGIGYTLVAVPEIIILDTTLPKYSGRELLVYLTSNQKFAQGNIKIIVISDGRHPEEISQLHYLNKADRKFATQLVEYIAKATGLDNYPDKLAKLLQDSAIKQGGQLVALGNRAESLFVKMQQAYFLPYKFILFLVWLISHVQESFMITWARLVFIPQSDTNLSQVSKDERALLMRTYPLTFISLVIGTIFVTGILILIIKGVPTSR